VFFVIITHKILGSEVTQEIDRIYARTRDPGRESMFNAKYHKKKIYAKEQERRRKKEKRVLALTLTKN
jgi:hypothetical protein